MQMSKNYTLLKIFLLLWVGVTLIAMFNFARYGFRLEEVKISEGIDIETGQGVSTLSKSEVRPLLGYSVLVSQEEYHALYGNRLIYAGQQNIDNIMFEAAINHFGKQAFLSLTATSLLWAIPRHVRKKIFISRNKAILLGIALTVMLFSAAHWPFWPYHYSMSSLQGPILTGLNTAEMQSYANLSLLTTILGLGIVGIILVATCFSFQRKKL
jgi:hypothetical protein